MYDAFVDRDETTPEAETLTRLDIEWLALNAIRELVKLGLKGTRPVSYRQCLALGARLWPEMFGFENSLILRHQVSDRVLLYRQKSDAISRREGKSIEPLEVINREIEELERDIASTPNNEKIREERQRLLGIRSELQKEPYLEKDILIRDAFRVERDLPVSRWGRDYTDYKLPKGRVLRVRLLHLDRIEALRGIDLLYESYSNTRPEARLVALQYKLLKDGVMRDIPRLRQQLDKMRTTFCEERPCAQGQEPAYFRMPYCAAFLRPTDELQGADARLHTTGYYIPRCAVESFIERGKFQGLQIKENSISSNAMSLDIFEKLFTSERLGSVWLNYDEIEAYHRRTHLLDPSRIAVLHAQDFGPLQPEEDANHHPL